MIRSDTIARFGSSAHSAGPTLRIPSIPFLQPVGRGDLPTFSLFRDDGSDSQQPPPIHDDRHIFCWHTGLRPVYCLQTTLKGSRRTARGASPGKKHASSHPGDHPRSDPERVGQDKPAREPCRHGRPGCQPGKAEAACTAHSGRTSGPATVPMACALGCPAGPLRGPFRFPDLVRFLTADKTIHPQCQVCPTASAVRDRQSRSFQERSITWRRRGLRPSVPAMHPGSRRRPVRGRVPAARPWEAHPTALRATPDA